MPKGTKLAFTSPEGRLVQGDAFEMNTKDKNGAPRVVKSGPNAGQPSPQMVLVVAFAKTDPAWPAFEAAIKGKAAEDFPQLFPSGPHGPCAHPAFAFKIQDGDGMDGDFKPNSAKEGHAGHWIVKFTSGFAAKVFNKDHYAPQEQVFKVAGQPAPGPRRGDYVRVSGTIEGNNDVAKPGVFVNCSLVEFSRPGIEIINGPSAAAAFGGAAGAAAAGGVTMLNGQSYEAFKAAGWTDDAMVQAGHAVRAVAPAPVPVPPPAPPAAQPAPAAHVMLPAANGVTYEQYRAAGWTDEAMVQAGYMAAPAVAPPVPPSVVSPPPPPGVPTPGVAVPSGIPAPGAASGVATPSPSNPPPPPYGGYMTPPPPAPGRPMTAAAQGSSYDDMIKAGWTDEMLVKHGMMLPN